MRFRSVARPWLLPVLLGALPSCGEAQGRTANAPPIIDYGTQVQVTSVRLGEGWHEGVVGRVGACLAVMVARGDNPPSFVAIAFDEVTGLRVREGDAWTTAPVAPLREAHGSCTPF